MQPKVNLPAMVEEQHLMEKVHGVLVMTLLEILQFLVKIIVYQLILIIKKKKVILELSEGPTDCINYGTDAAENNWVVALARQIQNLA